MPPTFFLKIMLSWWARSCHFLKALNPTRQRFTLREIDPTTLKRDELLYFLYFRPAVEAGDVVPDADVVPRIETTLLNDTLEGLLTLCRPDARVIRVGLTVGMLADAFLSRGVDVLGGVRVTMPDAFLDMLAEGRSVYHLFWSCRREYGPCPVISKPLPRP
jgi:uncharacterized protein (DUF4213/DUF364 family)